MAQRKKEYRGEKITVRYDLARCLHAAECVRTLPGVFDPERKPWVDPDAADAEAVASAVEKCPTGALTHELNRGETESPPSENEIRVGRDGPLYVSARLEITDGPDLYRAALCRCGESKNKPFCDNTHQESGFENPGKLGKGGVRGNRDDAESDVLRLRLAPDGPLLLDGPFEIVDAESGERRAGSGAALCRCGASQNKPFCDGSHSTSGFSGD